MNDPNGHCCVKGALHVPAPPTHHSRPNSAPISTSRGPIGPKLARLTLQRAARSVNATVPPHLPVRGDEGSARPPRGDTGKDRGIMISLPDDQN